MSEPDLVVGIDGSRTAERALLWAAAEADRKRLRLVIAHADPVAGNAAPTEFARTLMVDAQATVFDSGAKCEIATVLTGDEPARSLIRLSHRAELVVVGSHGLGLVAGSFVGSVAYRVAGHARCPVTLVPVSWQPAEYPSGPIVVGVSSTSGGLSALGYAFAEAALRGLALRAVRSWCRADWSPQMSETHYVAGTGFRLKQAERAELILRPFRDAYPTVGVTTVVTGDPIEEALLTAARSADQLIAGCRFRNRRRLSRLDWITSRLVHEAPCPVTVVGHVQSRRPELTPLRTG